jgi:hypothetical protein
MVETIFIGLVLLVVQRLVVDFATQEQVFKKRTGKKQDFLAGSF